MKLSSYAKISMLAGFVSGCVGVYENTTLSLNEFKECAGSATKRNSFECAEAKKAHQDDMHSKFAMAAGLILFFGGAAGAGYTTLTGHNPELK